MSSGLEIPQSFEHNFGNKKSEFLKFKKKSGMFIRNIKKIFHTLKIHRIFIKKRQSGMDTVNTYNLN